MKFNQSYIVEEILAGDPDLASRFYKLGVYPGANIKLIRKAPIFGDPLLFEVSGSQIAITKEEAKLLKVYVAIKGDECH